MRRPTKAILLAAGFGTRMRPLSWAVPKPLLPLWNRPLALRLIDMLAGWGVREILVNLHHGANEVFNSLRHAVAGEGIPVELAFSFEPDILGTGGALRRAGWFAGGDPFWLVNSDIAADVPPTPFLREMDRGAPVAVLWLNSHIGPRTVETRANRVISFKSANPASPGTATFCGLHLVSPELMRFLPDRPFSSVIEAYETAMARGRRVAGIEVPGSFWRDLGTPAQYIEAHAAWQARKRRAPAAAAAFRVVSPGARVAAGIKIENSVVMAGATVLRGAVLRNAILGPGSIVSSRAEGPVVGAVLPAIDAPPYARVAASIGWDPRKTAINALAPRGSDRSFSRMTCGRGSAILVEYGTARAENAAYAAHAGFLAHHKVRVPAVLLDWPGERILVMEDAGDVSLESVARSAAASRVEALYRRVLDNVLNLHSISRRSAASVAAHLQPAFGAAVYRWERELFAHHFLGPRLGMDQGSQAAVLSDLARVARRLSSAHPVIVHRDLQSSNVYLAEGGPVLIDFQGMRFGPAAYDVASLLCDPYVMLPDPLRERLLAYYLDRAPHPECVRRLFWWAAVQRLSQALGAFGRLSASPDTSRFAAHIPPAIAMIRRALRETPGLADMERAMEKAARVFLVV